MVCVPLPQGGGGSKVGLTFNSAPWLNVIVLIDDQDLHDKRCASIRRPSSRQALFKSSYLLGSFIFGFWDTLVYIPIILHSVHPSGLALQPFKAHQCKFFLTPPLTDPPSSLYIVRNSKRRSSVLLLQSSLSAVNKIGRFRQRK